MENKNSNPLIKNKRNILIIPSIKSIFKLSLFLHFFVLFSLLNAEYKIEIMITGLGEQNFYIMDIIKILLMFWLIVIL